MREEEGMSRKRKGRRGGGESRGRGDQEEGELNQWTRGCLHAVRAHGWPAWEASVPILVFPSRCRTHLAV